MRKDTIARAIPRPVKIRVAERDSIDGWPCCIFCGAPTPFGDTEWSNAHFVSRAQGGLGVEQNVLTLCPICHRKYDQTTARVEMRGYFRDYLKGIYPDWNEKDLYYEKGRLYADTIPVQNDPVLPEG